MNKIVVKADVRQRRSLEYPSLQTQLDALWDAIEELQISGLHHFSGKVQHVLVRVRAVQTKFPIPEEDLDS